MEEETGTRKIVLIGGSAGCLPVIMRVLKGLPAGLVVPVIIIVHRNNDPNSGLTNILDKSANITVKEAEDKETIMPATIYIAPADYHLLIEKDFSFSLDSSEKVNFSRPSIDVTFQTAAEAYGAGVMAILLSGANDDGAVGFREVRLNGGVLIAQEPKDASSPFMPQNVILQELVDRVLGQDEIAGVIVEFSSE